LSSPYLEYLGARIQKLLVLVPDFCFVVLVQTLSLHTIKTNEWEKESDKEMNPWPCETAGLMFMNPTSRQHYHKACTSANLLRA